MFIFIGSAPHTDVSPGSSSWTRRASSSPGRDLPRPARPTPGWPLDRDPFMFETNVPGIFAAGDVRAGSGKRVAAAVGEGSGCVGIVHRYLETV